MYRAIPYGTRSSSAQYLSSSLSDAYGTDGEDARVEDLIPKFGFLNGMDPLYTFPNDKQLQASTKNLLTTLETFRIIRIARAVIAC